jgi:hypothetical protein
MRISCAANDPGFKNWQICRERGTLRIYLDGVEMRDCVTADDSENFVEVIKRDADQKPIVEYDHVVLERREGAVHFTIDGMRLV